jgi:hypothetical protein
MQEKWHSWFDYRWGAWLFATLATCSWFRERQVDVFPDAITFDRWLLLAILFGSILPTLWYSVQLKSGRARRQVPRATWSGQVHALLSFTFVALVLLATYGRVWNFAEIGFRTTPPWNWTILLGLLCYRFLHLTEGWLARMFEGPAEQSASVFQRVWIGHFVPRGRLAQAMQVLLVGFVGPLHEEIVYRGFFVFMLSNLTGRAEIGIACGLILCVMGHLYQGVRSIPSHVLFYAASVALMFSPAGLLTALVMHIANNLHHAIALPRAIAAYREHSREMRNKKQDELVAAASPAPQPSPGSTEERE